MNIITLLVVELNNGVSFLWFKRPVLDLATAATAPALKVHLQSALIKRRNVVYLN